MSPPLTLLTDRWWFCLFASLTICVTGRGLFGFGTTSHAICWSCVQWSLSQLPSAQTLSAVHWAKNGSLQSLQDTFPSAFQDKCSTSGIINCFPTWQLTVSAAARWCHELIYVGLFLIHSGGVTLQDATARFNLLLSRVTKVTRVNSWHWNKDSKIQKKWGFTCHSTCQGV